MRLLLVLTLIVLGTAWTQEAPPADKPETDTPPATDEQPAPGLRFTAEWDWDQVSIFDLEAVSADGKPAHRVVVDPDTIQATISQGDRVYPAVKLEYG